jgi:hypothetical protein
MLWSLAMTLKKQLYRLAGNRAEAAEPTQALWILRTWGAAVLRPYMMVLEI